MLRTNKQTNRQTDGLKRLTHTDRGNKANTMLARVTWQMENEAHGTAYNAPPCRGPSNDI